MICGGSGNSTGGTICSNRNQFVRLGALEMADLRAT